MTSNALDHTSPEGGALFCAPGATGSAAASNTAGWRFESSGARIPTQWNSRHGLGARAMSARNRPSCSTGIWKARSLTVGATSNAMGRSSRCDKSAPSTGSAGTSWGRIGFDGFDRIRVACRRMTAPALTTAVNKKSERQRSTRRGLATTPFPRLLPRATDGASTLLEARTRGVPIRCAPEGSIGWWRAQAPVQYPSAGISGYARRGTDWTRSNSGSIPDGSTRNGGREWRRRKQ